MDEVAAAAQEQASGINQVNTAMSQIDQTTQQNASLVEETASASEELASQARELMNLVSFFTVDSRENAYGQTAPLAGYPQAGLQPQPGHEGTLLLSPGLTLTSAFDRKKGNGR